MATEIREVTIIRCDGCDKEQIDADGGPPPSGYYGQVSQMIGDYGTETVSWFACRATCIKTAIATVLATAGHGS